MLVSATKLTSNTITSYKHTLLPPLLLASKIYPTRCRANQSIRQKITSATGCSQILENAENQEGAVQGILEKAASLASSPKRGHSKAWVALVDAFLPKSLRSTQDAGGDEPAEDTKLLPALLSKARSTPPQNLDVLSYMGIQQRRWGAVNWLFQSLSREHQTVAQTKEHKRKQVLVPWSVAEPNPYEVTSLDDISVMPIVFDINAVQSAEASSLKKKIRLCFDSDVSRPEWLGQIWAMLAHMILRAVEYPTSHPKSQEIMLFVLETLAHLHHIDVVPRTIYTYSKSSDANESYKPPTLSLMAYRIMSALSDAAWKAKDKEVRAEGEAMGAKSWYKGHEMPEPSIQPHVDNLAKEIWLDLVLWCCVEGGYHTEAAWVVAEILKPKSQTPWRVIGWGETRRPEEPEMNWSVRAELEISRSHLSQIGPGFGFAGLKEMAPPVDMGPRTVSREVIVALIDGLASSLRPIAEIEPQIECCRSLLSQNRSLTLETNILNKAVMSIFTSWNVDAWKAPEAADRVLALTPIYDSSSEDHDDSPQSKIFEGSHENEVPAAFLGLLHSTLYTHTVKGNVRAALRTFRKIQTIIDDDRQRHIIEFAKSLMRAERKSEEDQLISESMNSIIPIGHPQIPTYILSKFLNLLTDAYLYDLGNWLLYSDDVDGPLIPPSLYSEPILQSSLLRFAIATKNGQLFTRISEKLRRPLETDILRTILHFQITLGKWDAARQVFRHLQMEPALGWRDTDIMFVVRSVLRLEKDEKSQPESLESLARARALLQQLLDGEFNLRRNPPQPLLVSSDLRRLNQIYLMLQTVSSSSSLRSLKQPAFTRNSRTTAPIKITSEAFNVLIEGMVETQGSLAGLNLWERWCGSLNHEKGSHAPRDDHDDQSMFEKLVEPTIQTLRVLTRPLVRKGKVERGYDKLLVDSAVIRYKWFGLTNEEIKWELPGLYDGRIPRKK